MNFGVNLYNWLLSNAQPLVKEHPSGWQGTASELTGWVRDTTGVNFTARPLSVKLRNLSEELLHYDHIVYTPPVDSSNGRRLHSLYNSVAMRG